jgi:DNA-damage-inducible protein D
LTEYGEITKIAQTKAIMDETMQALDNVKHVRGAGEYWMGREIQAVLGYSKWENFRAVIDRAIESCRKGGIPPRNHFLGSRKMVKIGSGAKVEVEDFFLSRYACYLVAMNGEASKPEVASAQQYFAVQTRLQELNRQQLNDQERLAIRKRLTQATKHLASAAKVAGVQRYDYFHAAGYLGLYEMGLAQIKRRKGISENEDLYDRAGRMELSANEFKANLTEQSILQKGITGQQNAEREHRRVGGVVRETIYREIGKYPEDLPAEPSLKKLLARKAKKELPPTQI